MTTPMAAGSPTMAPATRRKLVQVLEIVALTTRIEVELHLLEAKTDTPIVVLELRVDGRVLITRNLLMSEGDSARIVCGLNLEQEGGG